MTGLLRRAFERRGADVPITIDGVSVFAKEGDLLITAVLLHHSSLRKFEFGPGERAGFCWMGACQDCWVATESGKRLRACGTFVEEGMRLVTGAEGLA